MYLLCVWCRWVEARVLLWRHFVEEKPLDCKEKSSRAVHPLLPQIALHLKIRNPTLARISAFSPLPLPSPQHQWTLPPLQLHHLVPSCLFLSPITKLVKQFLRLFPHIHDLYAVWGTSKLKIVWVVPPVPTLAGQVTICSSLEAATSYPHSSNTWDLPFYFHFFSYLFV